MHLLIISKSFHQVFTIYLKSSNKYKVLRITTGNCKWKFTHFTKNKNWIALTHQYFVLSLVPPWWRLCPFILKISIFLIQGCFVLMKCGWNNAWSMVLIIQLILNVNNTFSLSFIFHPWALKRGVTIQSLWMLYFKFSFFLNVTCTNWKHVFNIL